MDTAEEEPQGEAPALTLFGLIRTLLAPATLPHLLGFLLVVVALFTVSERHPATAAAVYVGMALSYVVLALGIDHPSVRTAVLPSDGSRLRRSLQMILWPVVLGLLFSALLAGLANAISEGLFDLLPVGLGGLFVAWSIGQARSFRSATVRWPTTEDRARPRTSAGRYDDARRVVSTAMLLVAVFLVQSGLAGVSLLDPEVGLDDVLRTNLGLLTLLSGLLVVGEVVGRASRRACAHDASIHSTLRRWQVFAVAFAGWHLATAARHLGNQGAPLVSFVEEVVLMVVTVLLAIWSMTSRSRASELGLVRASNALFWGLGFGYAYAGSVAMLTTVLTDVTGVLSFGHVVVALSLMVLLRSTGGRLAKAHETAMLHVAQGAEVAARRAAAAAVEAPASTPEADDASTEEAAPLTEQVVDPAPAQDPSQDDPIEWLD